MGDIIVSETTASYIVKADGTRYREFGIDVYWVNDQGLIYHNHGTGNRDFLRVCGADCNGTFLPASPVLVAAQLPADHPAKRLALDYITRFEALRGPGSVSAFGSYTWDAGMLLGNAIPIALKAGAPGTPEFRRALRDALEATHGLADTNGVVNMSATDHLGLDQGDLGLAAGRLEIETAGLWF